jgi:GNAT superfamily N-acetyltransferase
MPTKHELIILPEQKKGDEPPVTPPVLRDRRAVLLVSTTSIDAAGNHWLTQCAFYGHQRVLRLETLVSPSAIHLTHNLDFILANDELRSRGLGGLVLRRAVDFAHDMAVNASVLVRSILLSAVDEKDPTNKIRRNRVYERVGFDLASLPTSRQLYRPLSQFRSGLGVPQGIDVMQVSEVSVYGAYATKENSRINREDHEAAKEIWSNRQSACPPETRIPGYARANIASGVVAVLIVLAALSALWFVW